MNNVLQRGVRAVAIMLCGVIAATSIPSETVASKRAALTNRIVSDSAHNPIIKISTKKNRRSSKRKSAYTGGRRISLNAPWKCVPGRLKSVIAQVSRKFGPVVINSTYRSARKNRLVGGKKKSYHKKCQAVDFRVRGRTRGLTRWLARHPKVGGWKRYRSGFYHIDTGPKRTW